MRKRNIILLGIAAAVTTVAVASGGAQAAAEHLIGSGQIKNESIKSIDVKNGTLGVRDLRPSAVGHLKGQNGTDGIDGIDGVDGADGHGTDGTDGENGTDGTNGVDGTNGTNGASAFDLWLAAQANDSGQTTADFFASLKGEQGEKGEPGKDGVDGTNGTNGVDGTNGTDGKDGVSAPAMSQQTICVVKSGASASWHLGMGDECAGKADSLTVFVPAA